MLTTTKIILPALFLALVGNLANGQKVIITPTPTINDRFPKKSGNLRMSSNLVRIGRISNTESKIDTIRLYNEGERPISLAPGKIPNHIRFTLGTTKLERQQESWIAIEYNAAKKQDFGYVYDRFELVTNDSFMPNKTISVSALIFQTFKTMSAEDSATSQKAKWTELIYEFGTIKKGSKLKHDFEVWNEGKQDLVILKAIARCACIKTTVSRDTIPPGAKSLITVNYNSASRKGIELHHIEVILNDPFKAEVYLEFKGEVTD